MARPQKNNADYFSHDNNMRNHRKIKAIRNKFGLEGYAIFNMFLETLTECDQFKIKLKREIDLELLSADFGIESSLLKEIIQYCVDIEIIIQDGDYYLSSNLIERLAPLTEKRERFREKYSKTEVSDAETIVSDAETIVSDAEMPQSKVNKTKLNKTKEEEKNKNFSPSDPKGSQEIVNVIELFKTVNPSYGKLFGNTTQRAAAARLAKLMPFDALTTLVTKILPEINADKYARGKAVTPLQFEDNIGYIKAWFDQKKTEVEKSAKKFNITRV